MSEYRVTLHEPHQVHHTVLLEDGVEVWPYTTILAGTSLGAACVIGTCCFLGRRCQIGPGTRIHPGAAIPDNAIIGARVFIGANVVLMDVAYPNLLDKAAEVHRPPVIEDNVVLGSNSSILPGVVIHAGAVVGAGSVVTRDVKAGAVVAGNPARVLVTAQGNRVLDKAGAMANGKAFASERRPHCALDIYQRVIPRIPQESSWSFLSERAINVLSSHDTLLTAIGMDPSQPLTRLSVEDGSALYVQPPLPEGFFGG